MRLAAIAATLLALAVAGCGRGNAEAEMVWCVAPGEEVTPAFKREYPDLYMPKSECEVWENFADR